MPVIPTSVCYLPLSQPSRLVFEKPCIFPHKHMVSIKGDQQVWGCLTPYWTPLMFPAKSSSTGPFYSTARLTSSLGFSFCFLWGGFQTSGWILTHFLTQTWGDMRPSFTKFHLKKSTYLPTDDRILHKNCPFHIWKKKREKRLIWKACPSPILAPPAKHNLSLHFHA